MKRILIGLMLVMGTMWATAQSLVSFGAHGGVDFLMPKSEIPMRSKLGMAGLFDIGYTFYVPGRALDCGLHIGLSGGYAANVTRFEFEQQFTNFDYLGNEMQYATSGAMSASLQRFYVEMPLMLALRSNHFVLQLGAKAQYTLRSKTVSAIEETLIDAYYVPYDVHVVNELITGKVPAEMLKSEQAGGAPLFSVAAAGRIGYEGSVGTNGKLGIMLYVDYSVWNNYTNTGLGEPVLSVHAIANPSYPVPDVTINNALYSFVTRIHPLQAGISFYYGIEFGAQNQQRYSRYSRPRYSRSRYTRRYR